MQQTHAIDYQSRDGPMCRIIRVMYPGRRGYDYGLEIAEELCKVQESIDGKIERVVRMPDNLPPEQLTDRPFKIEYLTIHK